jgi:hypothetical protein
MALEIFNSEKSIFIRLKIRNFFGVGEYAFLESIHSHTNNQVLNMLKSLKESEIENLLILSGTSLELASYFKKFAYPVSYLLSQVYFSNQILKKPALESILLCGLIETTNLKDSENSAQDFYEKNFSAIKIKVGKLSLKEDIKRLDKILEISKSMKVRLDANQALNLSEALALIKNRSIEYFEEPLKNLHEIKKLKEKVLIAADESFREFKDLHELLDRAEVLVLKPSRFHSIYELILIIEKALDLGIKPVLSHAYESELSTAIFSFLASRLKLSWPQGILASKIFFNKAQNKIELADAQKVLLSFL